MLTTVTKIRNSKRIRREEEQVDRLAVRGPSLSTEEVTGMAEESVNSGHVNVHLNGLPPEEKLIKERIESEYRQQSHEHSTLVRSLLNDIGELKPEFREVNEVYKNNNKRPLDTKFAHWICIAFLVVFGLFESPVNIKVFVAFFRENQWFSILVGVGLTVAFMFLAHWIGVLVKSKKYGVAIPAVIGILALFVLMSVFRNQYVAFEAHAQTEAQRQLEALVDPGAPEVSSETSKVKTLLDYIPESLVIVMFWCLNAVFFLIGIILAHGSKDSDGFYESKYKLYHVLYDNLRRLDSSGHIATSKWDEMRNKFSDGYEHHIQFFRKEVSKRLGAEPSYARNPESTLKLDLGELPRWDDREEIKDLKALLA